jgi:hypothetical protein
MAYRSRYSFRAGELLFVTGILGGIAFMGWINKSGPVAYAAPAPVDYVAIATAVRAAMPPAAPVAVAAPVAAPAPAPAPVAAPAKPAPVAVAAPAKRKASKPVARPVVYYVVPRCGCGA